MSEYALFQKEEYIAKTEGYNYIFPDSRAERIVINKNDKSAFTKEEIDAISKLPNVKTVVENDLLLDTEKDVTSVNREIWMYTKIYSLDIFEGKLDYGRMPEADNEIVVETNKDDYFFKRQRETTLENEFVFTSEYGDIDPSSPRMKVVGIKYSDSYDYRDKIYAGSAIVDQLIF